jgi:hypothetical protein
MIGIFTPLYARPDFARFAALQFAAQTVPPDWVAFHQNGTQDRFEWAIEDLTLPYQYQWIHTPEQLENQCHWYSIPLRFLLEQGCQYFFWADQDDIYRSNHIEESIKDLQRCDMVINSTGGLLAVKRGFCDYIVGPFAVHDPGGISSSMAFNRPFAEELLKDLEANTEHYWADNVMSKVTMPKFICGHNSSKMTVTYVCHQGTVSTSHWLE